MKEQFFKLTLARVKEDYQNGWIKAEAYILYILDITTYKGFPIKFDQHIAEEKYGIKKKSYYRAMRVLKDSKLIFITEDKKIVRMVDDNTLAQYQKFNRLTKDYNEFLQSPYWQMVKLKVKDRDDYTCLWCGSVSNLQVHHLSYKHHGDELNHLEDLVTLCKSCHETMHGY